MTAIDPMVELESWMVSLDLPFAAAPLLDHPSYAVLMLDGQFQMVVHVATALDRLRATTREYCDRVKGLVLLDAIRGGLIVVRQGDGWAVVSGEVEGFWHG